MRTAIAAHDLLPEGLNFEGLSIRGKRVRISAASRARRARCPVRGHGSSRVHSRYRRAVSDLPWHGISVKLEVCARRFFCDEASRERRIFRERLPDLAPRARKTDRLEEALLAIVLGVDDFAFRKGNAYGTILVDLERHKVVDLLPECSQESLAAWLERHPGVEVATRDRSRIYREGIARGAPNAAQVAGRWHLLHGLALGLEGFLLHKRSALGKAAAPGTDDKQERLSGSIDDGGVSPLSVPLGRLYGSVEGPAEKRHERLVERWRCIRRLHLAGASVKDIAEWVGASPSTVYHYRELAEPPPRPRHRRGASVLDPYLPYLLKRWNEGCRIAKRRLHAKIRERATVIASTP